MPAEINSRPAAPTRRRAWRIGALQALFFLILITWFIIAITNLSSYWRLSADGIVKVAAWRSGDDPRFLIGSGVGADVLAAGIQLGDELIAIDGTPVDPAIQPTVSSPTFGAPVTFTLRHADDGRTQTYILPANSSRMHVINFLLSLGVAHPVTRLLALAFELLALLSFAAVAGVLFWKRRDDALALLLAITLLLLGLRTGELIPGLNSLLSLLVAHGVVITASLFLTLFPSGRFRGWIGIALWVAYNVFELSTTLLPGDQGYALIAPLFYAAFFIRLMLHYRRDFSPAQRQQTKWLLIGIACGIIGFFLPAIVGLSGSDTAFVAAYTLGRVLLLGVPLAIGAAILRYRLYEVDLVINRALVIAASLIGLGLLFAVVFFTVMRLSEALFGSSATALALIAAHIAMIIVSRRLRRRLQRLVDIYIFRLRAGIDDYDKEIARPTADAGTVVQRGAERVTQTMHHIRRTLTTAAAAPKLALPPVIAGYELSRVLGRGGMGEVYLAYQSTTAQHAAIKILRRSDLKRRDEFRARFERESETLGRLQHPNIVKLHHYGVEGDVYYAVMEYIDGETLADYIADHDRIPLPVFVPLLEDIAAALDHIHAQHVVHRDIKPRNIMLRHDSAGRQRAVLMDFGIVKLLDGVGHIKSLTGTGMIGTIDYAAPEQINAARRVDHRADIYSLGVTAYYALTGHLPFNGSIGQVLFAHLHQPPPDTRSIAPDLPEAAADALARALAKQPEARFQSAGAFAATMRAALRDPLPQL
jgi:hypothetical protein